jgi:F-type H+-transporting ATPase subunit gamma
MQEETRRQEQIRQRVAERLRLAEQYHEHPQAAVQYDFSPSAQVLMDELLPLTVKTALFQCFLDAASSENVARMVAMKSATDNADKMVRSLTMQYNRARQTQITTELSEIMGGVEAMKG